MQRRNFKIKSPNERELSFLILYRVLEEDGYTNLSIQSTFKTFQPSFIERNWATAAVYGVTSRLTGIDYILNKKLKRPLEQLQPAVRTVLRLGVWELTESYESNVAAICDQACNLTKKVANRGAVGLVNGVLRALIRKPVILPKKDLGLQFGLIPELAGLFKKWFGDEAAELLKAFDQQTNLTVRLRDPALPENWQEEESTFSPASFMPEGRFVHLKSNTIADLPSFKNGSIMVQGEGAMLAGSLHGLRSGNCALDACAAPGSKTIQLADAVGLSGQVIAQDIHPVRLQRIKDHLHRCNVHNVELMERDATQPIPSEWTGMFDAVLVDAPCSGLGQLGNRPELRFRMTYEQIQSLYPLQKQILEVSAQAVKPGGRLIYSTCTLNPAENEGQLLAFLDSHSQFVSVDLMPLLPKRLLDKDPTLQVDASKGYITLRPDRHNCEGFFVGLMELKEN